LYDNEKELASLSAGEYNFLQLITTVIHYIYFNQLDNNENIYLLLDEIELGSHPNWQKSIVNNLLVVLREFDINIKIMFLTHSPFLISDLPKENVLFLKNGKSVKGIKHNQTFGANIHTLLSDSFFMEDGLMGEFAKGKINQVKRFYTKVIKYKDNQKVIAAYKKFYDNKKQNEFWQIQKIIGEPFLQKIVKNQLEEIELILLGKDEAIDNEIARLQDLKKSLKNG
jgi:predicted ATP-binding protein involved in virulence